MADRDTPEETGDAEDAFVFGEEREASTTGESGESRETSATGVGSSDTLTTAVVGVVAALVLIVAAVQLFGPGVAAVLDGGDGSQAQNSSTPIDVAPTGETTAPARDTDDALATSRPGGEATSGDQATSGAPGNGAKRGDTTAGDGPNRDGVAGETDESLNGDGSGETNRNGTSDSGMSGDGTSGDGTSGSETSDGSDGNSGGGFVQTDSGEGGPPSIESVSVLDDSQAGASGGTLVYEVGWTVTDPDDNLASLTVTLLADPAGETTTVARRPFDIGGGRNQSTTTFEAPIDSLGESYEIRVVAEDQFGNSVNVTRREVANGEPD